MASWSVLLALTGSRWSAVEGALTFAPREEATRDGTFRSFFTCGSGWGVVEASEDGARVEVREGELTARRIEVTLPGGRRFGRDGDVTVGAGEGLRL
jgi:hypothetical protein